MNDCTIPVIYRELLAFAKSFRKMYIFIGICHCLFYVQWCEVVVLLVLELIVDHILLYTFYHNDCMNTSRQVFNFEFKYNVLCY